MKLYYSPTSPYVRKVNICAIELGIDKKLERIVTNPWVTDTALLTDNPLSKVPTLITDDGLVLYDSPVICEYLDTKYGSQRLIPADETERWLALRLQALGDGILDAAVLRFLERKRSESQHSSDWDEMQQSVIQRALKYLESEVNEWNSDVTIGQITVACALGYLDFRFAEDNWHQNQPRLAAWFESFSARPSMRTTIPKANL